jgi:hypothetical protein
MKRPVGGHQTMWGSQPGLSDNLWIGIYPSCLGYCPSTLFEMLGKIVTSDELFSQMSWNIYVCVFIATASFSKI